MRLEYVTNRGRGMALAAMLEVLGQPWPVYACPRCKVEREFYQNEARSGNVFAVCSECADVYRVVEEGE